MFEQESTSATVQIAICNILTSCCRTAEYQNTLVTNGVLSSLTTVLSSHVTQVQVSGLQTLATIVHNNVSTSTEVLRSSCHGKSLLSLIIMNTGRENNVDNQVNSRFSLVDK